MSPGSNSTGRRSTCATAAAVIMLVAPGPIEVVQTIICRRRAALAKATALCAIACSLWARKVGSVSCAWNSASPMPATLPCPKIAHTPANSGTSLPSRMLRWLARYRTTACAMVRRTVFIEWLPVSILLASIVSSRRRIGALGFFPGVGQAGEAPGHFRDRAGIVQLAAQPGVGRLGEDGAADGEALDDGVAGRRLERLLQRILAGVEAQQHHAAAERVAGADLVAGMLPGGARRLRLE